MKILVVVPNHSHVVAYAKWIVEGLRSFGNEVVLLAAAPFSSSCSYFERKMTKFGVKKYERRHTEKLLANWEMNAQNLKPDFVLVLDGLDITPPLLEFLKRYKMILWLWDHFQRYEILKDLAALAAEIFCFEYEDVASLREKYKVPTHYLPLGANEKIYYPAECERDIDISFVGWTSKKRLEILEAVCGLAVEKNLSVKIGGPFHDSRYFWKKYIFGRRQKNLARFLENRMFESAEIAELYRRSKICLNINISEHHSLNPRTFEICATKSFQLMNRGGIETHGLINLETDLATFDDTADLLEKIPYYLANDELREKIATSGYNAVIKNCTLKKSVEKLWAESEVVQSFIAK